MPMYRWLDSLLAPLKIFMANPSVQHDQSASHIYTATQGCPHVNIDIEKIMELRDLGGSWNAIAKAVRVTCQTLYNHMKEKGPTTSRPKFTEVGDDVLDEVVSQITLDHPFMGIKMDQGHLKACDIHLPYLCVQDSMHRVGLIGTLIR
jgi:hypothetical protein